jgi:hypothetical protein
MSCTCLLIQIEALEAADAGHKDPLVSPVLIDTTDLSDKDNTLADAEENVAASQELSEETPAEEVGTSGEEEDFGEFIASETTLAGKMLLTWRKRREEVVYALVGHHLYQKQFIVALQWLNQLLARLVASYSTTLFLSPCLVLGDLFYHDCLLATNSDFV